jgi:hypothetical protein
MIRRMIGRTLPRPRVSAAIWAYTCGARAYGIFRIVVVSVAWTLFVPVAILLVPLWAVGVIDMPVGFVAVVVPMDRLAGRIGGWYVHVARIGDA